MATGITYAEETTLATDDTTTPSCQPALGNGVWFKFTPVVSGTITFSTCGSDFDTALAVYTGSCGTLTEIKCADDDGPVCAGLTASVRFSGTAGTTYRVLVGGYDHASGMLHIQATVRPLVLTSLDFTNGLFQFVVTGQPGSNCVVQTSSNLVNWVPLLTNLINATGSLSVTDRNAARADRRFYRALLR
jgi:hypothetical protein